MKKKVILAFSGGLDTSFCVLWLKKQGYEVVTLTVDSGGFSLKEQKNIEQQSQLLGSSKHYFIDGRKDLYQKVISYIIKGNILRGDVYPLCAGPERLIIAEKLTLIAKKENADGVVHGSTGAGNDQVRFETALRILNPKLKIMAPIRDMGIKREEEKRVLQKEKIPVSNALRFYSVNKSMLGVTVGGRETNGSWECPPDDVYPGITPIAKTPNSPADFILSFQKGLPIAIDKKQMEGLEIMEYLNRLGGKHGVGKNIHLGNTILGIKGRIAFAAPAITILIKAHKELEKLVLSKWQLFWKDHLGDVYGNFLHEALYFEPVMRDFEALIDNSQYRVTGKVKVKLHKGNIIIEGYKSPYSLMNPEVAVYGEENTIWTGAEAAAFSKIYALQSILASSMKGKT